MHRLADDESNSSDKLFEYYEKVLKNYMRDAQREIKKEEGERLIDSFLYQHNQCKILTHWMRRIFSYLDRFYTKNKNIGTLCENGMKIFHDEMFLPLKDKLFESVNKFIELDRDCAVVQRYKVKNLLRIFEEVDMKKADLIKTMDDLYWKGEETLTILKEWFDKFLIKTEQYVSKKASNEITSLSAPEYIKSALKYLDEEETRKAEYINKIFYEKLNSTNYRFLINQNSKTLASMETGIAFMFFNKKDTSLKEAYQLISKLPESLKCITEELEPFIKKRGEELYSNKDLSKDPVKFIPELIKLKKEIDTLVEFAFDNHLLFQDSKNKAFSYFMNKELYSKQLANFCDFEMKVGFKGAGESQIDERLNNIINLFKCLNNKLIFQIEYAKKLSDRLIQGKSLSMLAEKALISKLKAEAGVSYVNKLTSMLQDLEVSKTENDNYRANPQHKGVPHGVALNVKVLQNGAWEIEKNKFEKFEVPKFLVNCVDDFTKFYIGRHKTHKLTWVYGLGTIELQYLYLKKNHQSDSTLIQYCILRALETHKTLSIVKVSEVIGYNQNLVLNEINALLYHVSFNPKKSKSCGIISSDAPDGQDLKLENEVSINKDFTVNSIKISTIPTVFRVKIFLILETSRTRRGTRKARCSKFKSLQKYFIRFDLNSNYERKNWTKNYS